MNVFVIHDQRQPDDEWELCLEGLEDQKIDYEIHSATIDKSTVLANISASHKSIVELARYMRCPEVCIMESDVWFPAIDGWRYFLDNKPGTFDLYLGGSYGPIRGALPDDPSYGEAFCFVDRPSGFHCYIIHERYYDKFLATSDDLHIDDAQVGGIYKVCFPFAAIQRPGWSANAKDNVNYNHKLTKEMVYGW